MPTDQELREIIKEEIQAFFNQGPTVTPASALADSSNTNTLPDRTVHQKHIQILDARNIQLGRTNGTMIGTASDQKLGFYGTTPVIQQSNVAGPSGSGTAGVDSPARNAINGILLILQRTGLMKS